MISLYFADIGDEVYSPRFELYTSVTHTEGGECAHIVEVSGKGLKDKFYLECQNGLNIMNVGTSISNEDYIIYIDGDEKLSLFTDTPSTLIVFKDDKCTKRTYTTTGKVTEFKEAPMKRSECEKQLQKMEEAKKEYARKLNEKKAQSRKDKSSSNPLPLRNKPQSKPTPKKKPYDDIDEWNF